MAAYTLRLDWIRQTVVSVCLFTQPQLVYHKSIVSTSKVGKTWLCGSWELFTKRNTLQIVHSVSGNVIFKHLKQFFHLPEQNIL